MKVIENHKYTILCSDITKTESSNRILPLPDKIIKVLKGEKVKQIQNYIKIDIIKIFLDIFVLMSMESYLHLTIYQIDLEILQKIKVIT